MNALSDRRPMVPQTNQAVKVRLYDSISRMLCALAGLYKSL
jgi:hypothetical protein